MIIIEYGFPIGTYAAVCGILAYLVARERGRGRAGALWGFLLGSIGVIVAFFLEERRPVVAAPSGPDPIDAENARRREAYYTGGNPDRPKY